MNEDLKGVSRKGLSFGQRRQSLNRSKGPKIQFKDIESENSFYNNSEERISHGLKENSIKTEHSKLEITRLISKL